MQPATANTVLGKFDNARFTHRGVTTIFTKIGGAFVVRTPGPDGKTRNYKVAYTFGIKPLQQYLVEFPGGRLQAFSVAWDTRPKAKGGQRWFHLLPKVKMTARHRLH
ncbi:MAG: hypothetical protein ACU0DI_15885 [Paracoccaceae bacterium]